MGASVLEYRYWTEDPVWASVPVLEYWAQDPVCASVLPTSQLTAVGAYK